MNTDNSLRQFVNDGLKGILVALLFLLPILGILMLIFSFPPTSILSPAMIFLKMPYMSRPFIGPLPFVILTAFVGAGISGRFVENISSRKEWIKSMLIVSGISGLTGIGSSTLILILFGYIQFFIFFMGDLMLAGGIGVMIGFLMGGLAGVIFNPNKRLHRIIISAISCAITGFGMGAGIWLFMMRGYQ